MKRNKRILGLVLFFSLAGLGMAGEVAAKKKTKPPLFLHSEFYSRGVDEVVLLPVVDLREVEEPRNGDGFARRMIRGGLKKLKYEVMVAEEFAETAATLSAHLAKPASDWIGTLGPGTNRWILVVTIEHLEKVTSVAAQAEARIHGYLFDKEKGDLLWEGRGTGEAALGFLMAKLVEGSALEAAAADMMLSFPPKSRK